jgi:hypothetical protein
MWLSTRSANSMFHATPLRTNWGAYLRFVYAFLLAVVFPFICWGQSGQSDHPHPRAHFVFAAPPGFQPFVPPADGTSLTQTFTHSQHLPSGSSTSPAKEIAGQSIPSTLALFSLLLVFAHYLWQLYRPTSQKPLFSLALGSAQTTPALRLPPPRTR